MSSPSRRRRAAASASPRLPRWLVAAGPIAVLALVGWLFFRDAGASGTPGSLASHRPPDVHALAVHPDDAGTLIFGSHDGILVSRDGGTTWSSVGPRGDAMDLAIPPGSRTAYAAGHDVFFRSDDGGETWTTFRAALPGTDIHGLTASAVRDGTFYAFVVGQGLFRSDDSGETWQVAGQPPGSTMSLAAARGAGGEVLFATTMQGVQRSSDGGRTWEPVPELGGAYVSATGSTVYAASRGTVFISSDGGSTWEQRAFPSGDAVLIAASPEAPSTVYVVTGQLEVWRSPDGAATWERAG